MTLDISDQFSEGISQESINDHHRIYNNIDTLHDKALKVLEDLDDATCFHILTIIFNYDEETFEGVIGLVLQLLTTEDIFELQKNIREERKKRTENVN